MATVDNVKTAYKAINRADLSDAQAQAFAAAIDANVLTLQQFIAQQLQSTTGQQVQAEVATFAFLTGAAPSSAQLDNLAVFARTQANSYNSKGQNGTVAPFEALGLDIATNAATSAAFATKYGSLSDQDFISSIYITVTNGTAPSFAGPVPTTGQPAQSPGQALQAQLNYFTSIYTAAGYANPALAARGAVAGQIISLAYTDSATAAKATIDDQSAQFLTNLANGNTAGYSAPLPPASTGSPLTFNLTIGVDSGAAFTGGGAADTFNAADAGANGVSPTLTSLDSLDGGAGVDTLNVTQTTAFNNPNVTIKNIEKVNIVSGSTVTADTTKYAGLTDLNVQSAAAAGETITAVSSLSSVTVANSTAQTLTIVGGGGVGSFTNGGAAITVGKAGGGAGAATDINGYTSVSVKGGSANFVTDNSGTAGAVGTKLTTVSVDGSVGTTTLNGNAIANVNAANGIATDKIVVTNASAAAQTLNLTVNKSAAGFNVTDATAKTVNVSSLGAATGASASVDLTIAAATTLNTSGSFDLALGTATENYTALTTVNIANTGKFSADFSATNTATAAAITSIVATTSTGANTLAIDATKTTYAGGSGVDAITIAAAPTKSIDGGAGSNDKLVLNVAAATFSNPSANTKIVGFETLGLGAAATGTYDATGFLHLAVDNAIAGNSAFSNVGAGVDLAFTAASTKIETISLFSDTLADTLAVSTSGAAGIANSIVATGYETLNLSGSQTGGGTTNIIHQLTVDDATATSINVTTGALTGYKLIDTTSTKLVTVNASGVQGDGVGTAGSGFEFTTGAIANTTPGTTMTTITGSKFGGDTISAANALDMVTITETAGVNSLTGSSTNKNFITGGTGVDTIVGGGVADTIVGGGGKDIITAGAGADSITISGTGVNINQGIGDSGANAATNVQTAVITSTFDVVKGAVAGDTITITGNANIAAATNVANLAAGANDTAVYAYGTYDAANGTFNYGAAGADTLLTYDSTSGATVTAESVVLVGFHVNATTAAAGGVITLA